MRRPLVLATLVVAGAVAPGAPPVRAQVLSFALNGGTLSITEPGTTTIASGPVLSLAGSTITGSLGSTTVTDQRGGVLGWTVSIAQPTTFANGSTSLPAIDTKVWVPGVIVPTSGVATVSAGLYTSQLTPLSLVGTPQPYVWATAVVGDNTTSFSPSIAVTLPANATVGSYTGVVSQTVA